MTGPSLEEISELLLGGARQHGATAADAVVAEGDSLMVGVRLGQVERMALRSPTKARIFLVMRSPRSNETLGIV